MAKKIGFTLLELMIVMVIVGIMAAVAVPAYSKYREKEQFKTTIEEIVNSLYLISAQSANPEQGIKGYTVENWVLISSKGCGSTPNQLNSTWPFKRYSLPVGGNYDDKTLLESIPLNGDWYIRGLTEVGKYDPITIKCCAVKLSCSKGICRLCNEWNYDPAISRGMCTCSKCGVTAGGFFELTNYKLHQKATISISNYPFRVNVLYEPVSSPAPAAPAAPTAEPFI